MYFRFYWVKTGQPTLLLHYQVLWPAKPIMAQDFSNITGSEHISKQPNRGHFGRWTVADWYSETHIRTLTELLHLLQLFCIMYKHFIWGGKKHKSNDLLDCGLFSLFRRGWWKWCVRKRRRQKQAVPSGTVKWVQRTWQRRRAVDLQLLASWAE